MASYTFSLTPNIRTRTSEGSLDTSVLGGNSYQRTGYLDVYNSAQRKIVKVADGATFTDAIAGWSEETEIIDD